jgi:hypothetical protein
MDTHLITIARFPVPETAHLAKHFLDLNGIASFVIDEGIVGVDWELGNTAVGGVKLQVAESDYDHACKMLAASELDGSAGKKGRAVNPIRWFWWKASWGRPPKIVVIGTWIWYGVPTLLTLPAIVHSFVWDSPACPGTLDCLAVASLALFFGGFEVFWIAAITRVTYLYVRFKDREEGGGESNIGQPQSPPSADQPGG